ncbi:MAG: pyrrolo-quinoline quinone [Planctomycetes bacterium]|nr:pyrrolo-quinoline quinone [Planctomycetota bacterium]
MRIPVTFPLFLLTLTLATPALAQNRPAPTGNPERAARHAKFKELLTGSRLVGFFTTEGQKGPAKRDSYTIKKVVKLKGDKWRIQASVEYRKIPITVPIIVDVRWAGDTPMIQITKLNIPLLGTFTARVLFYDGQYAGMWSGDDHGGQMYGRVVPADEGKGDQGPKKQVNWPSFRGKNAEGNGDGSKTPVKWNVETGENVRWKTRVPGLSHSSPVIWGDRIYLTSAVKEGDDDPKLKVGRYGSIASVDDDTPHEMQVLCVDKKTGKILWTKTAWKGVPKIKRHPKGTHAASTPATDGKYVVAFFGSEGLYCYDTAGTLVWQKDLGVLDSGYFKVPTAQWGFASSPIIHAGRVIVQCDVQGDNSFLAVYEIATGKQVWRTPRDEVPTWGSPTVHEGQVIVNGWKNIGGYDLATGKQVWKVRGGGDIPVPTPIVAHDLIFITNAHGRSAPILAISTKAKGEFSMTAEESPHMVWSKSRRGNYMQTPLVYGDYLYCCNGIGALTCIDAKTGEQIYRERIPGGGAGFTGSGVAADGKLYFPGEDGEIHVIEAGRDFNPLAVNGLGEECLSTPAVSEGALFFRARRHLFAVGLTK